MSKLPRAQAAQRGMGGSGPPSSTAQHSVQVGSSSRMCNVMCVQAKVCAAPPAFKPAQGRVGRRPLGPAHRFPHAPQAAGLSFRTELIHGRPQVGTMPTCNQ